MKPIQSGVIVHTILNILVPTTLSKMMLFLWLGVKIVPNGTKTSVNVLIGMASGRTIFAVMGKGKRKMSKIITRIIQVICLFCIFWTMKPLVDIKGYILVFFAVLIYGTVSYIQGLMAGDKNE